MTSQPRHGPVSYTHLDVYKRQGVGSPQRKALWRVVESFKEVFAELPGRARNYECELKVREHAPYVQRSYPVPYSKRRAVQVELDRMLEGDIIERSVSPYFKSASC